MNRLFADGPSVTSLELASRGLLSLLSQSQLSEEDRSRFVYGEDLVARLLAALGGDYSPAANQAGIAAPSEDELDVALFFALGVSRSQGNPTPNPTELRADFVAFRQVFHDLRKGAPVQPARKDRVIEYFREYNRGIQAFAGI